MGRAGLRWLVVVLALMALIAVFVVAKATYTGDECRVEVNERVDPGGATEEAGCSAPAPRRAQRRW